jgi:hypothetical protein
VLSEFVDGLPINGRTSLLTLLKAAGCPLEEHGFIECVRRVRNAYAHNIKYVDVPLLRLVTQRADKSHLLKNLSAIEKYDEINLVGLYEKDPGMLRFGILDSAMRFLFYAYHITIQNGRGKRQQRRPPPLEAMKHCAFSALLPNGHGRATKDGMRVFARHLLLIFAVLAFAAGMPLALAVPPMLAAEACPPEHHEMMLGDAHHEHQAPQKPPHRHDAAACLCCCVGACVAIPDLARGGAIAVPFTVTAVLYPEKAASLAGRSLRPEPAPPRTSAHS